MLGWTPHLFPAMNSSPTLSSNRSNLWALKPRETATAASPTHGTPTIAMSLPPRSSCEYWTRRLGGKDLELSLPFASPENRMENTALVTPTVEVSADLAERVRTLARNELTTTFTLLLAAWQVVLFRHCKKSDFVVGCGTPGGRITVQERPLIVHATVSTHSSFRTLLRGVAMRRAEGATHGDVALPDLVNAFDAQTTAGRHPLFQVAFVQRNSLSEAATHTTDNKHCAPVDLACVWEDNGRTIRVRAEYPAGVLAPDIAARIPVHLVNILRAAVSLPEAPIGTLPMLTSAEYLEKARA